MTSIKNVHSNIVYNITEYGERRSNQKADKIYWYTVLMAVSEELKPLDEE